MSRKRRNNPPVKPEQGKQSSQVLHQVKVQQQLWQGPLPAPDQLAEFDAIVPGCANRIITMAEQEGKHEREMQMLAVKGMIRMQFNGQLCALIVSLVTIIAAYYLAMADHDTVASILVSTSLVSIVLAFLNRKKNSE